MRYLYFSINCCLIFSCTEVNENHHPTVAIEIQDSGVDVSFRGLSVVDETTAWASGPKGTVVTTSDGGHFWKNVSAGLADSVDYRDIEAFSSHEAIILSAGSPGLIYKTSNAGESWDLVYKDDRTEIFFDAMGFWNQQAGIAFGDALDGKIEMIRTEDGGKSWQQLPDNERPDAQPGEGGFAASGTCLITFGDSSVWIALGVPDSRVIYSHNRGRTWKSTSTPIKRDIGSAGIFSLGFATPAYGLAIGGNYLDRNDTTQLLALTSDNGKSWSLAENNGLNGQKSAITPVLFSDIWLATGATGVNISYDNGLTWTMVDTTGYYTVQMASKNVGWLSGASGKIGKLKLTY